MQCRCRIADSRATKHCQDGFMQRLHSSDVQFALRGGLSIDRDRCVHQSSIGTWPLSSADSVQYRYLQSLVGQSIRQLSDRRTGVDEHGLYRSHFGREIRKQTAAGATDCALACDSVNEHAKRQNPSEKKIPRYRTLAPTIVPAGSHD